MRDCKQSMLVPECVATIAAISLGPKGRSCGWITSPLHVTRSGDVIHPQLRPLGLGPRLCCHLIQVGPHSRERDTYSHAGFIASQAYFHTHANSQTHVCDREELRQNE